jgi:hypothetical protein
MNTPFNLLLAATLICAASCQNAPQKDTNQGPESVAGISLSFEYLGEDALGIPRSVPLLIENGGATALDTVSVNLARIERERYSEMGIPSDALDACGGWYAGGGDYFYVVKRKGRAVVYQGYQEETQTDTGYHWTAIEVK